MAAAVAFRARDQREGGAAGRRDRGRQGGGEDETARPVDEQLAKSLAAGHVGAEGAEALPSVPTRMSGSTPARRRFPARPGPSAATACASSTISQAPLRAQTLGEWRQRRPVAVHREDRLGHDQRAPRDGTPGGEDALEDGDVEVRVDLDRGTRESASVDDAGVVELVGEDEVAPSDQRRDDPDVRLEAGVEQQRGLGPVEAGQLDLERLVLGVVAGDEARGGRAQPRLGQALRPRRRSATGSPASPR